MARNSLTNDKLIYQFGNATEPNYVFYKGSFSKTVNTSLKTMYSEAQYIEGQVDMLQNKKALKNTYDLECSFVNPFNSKYDLNFINRVFFGTPKVSFFYDYAYDSTLGKGQRSFGKIYYNYCRTIKPPNQTEIERENMQKTELENTVILRPNTPRFYDCSDDVEYISYTTWTNAVRQWDNNALEWDNAGTVQWDYATAQFAVVSGLSNANKIAYFTDLLPTDEKYFLLLKDRFFKRDTTQANRTYIINETQNANTSSDYTTTTDLENASGETDVYRIELNQMAVGQSIEIYNIDNNSAIKINWTDTSASNAVLVYNSVYSKLYETSNETEIDNTKYTIEIPSYAQRALYFDGLVNPYRILDPNTQQVRLTNNGSNNLTVKIDVLPAYD